MGTVTLLRRVVGYASVVGILGVLAWLLVTAKLIVLSAGGLLVAAVVSGVLGAAAAGAAGSLQAAGGCLCLLEQGRTTDATIVSLE